MSIANLQGLSTTELNVRLKKLLEALEGRRPYGYRDSAGNATIGIGFNLGAEKTAAKVFAAMDLSRTEIDALNLIVGKKYTTDAAVQTALQTALGRPFVLDDVQIDTILTQEISANVAAVKGLTGITIDSNELVTLTSLYFNSPGLIGPGLKSALALTDPFEARAEAWYQIRYRSNGEGTAGVAKRRYVESEMFGLYGQGITAANVSKEQALAVGRMWTLHHKEIEAYERQHGIWDAQYGSVTAQGNKTGLQLAAEIMAGIQMPGITGAYGAGTVYEELSSAMAYLIKNYATDPGYAQADQIAITRVWVGDKAFATTIGEPEWGSGGTDQADLIIGGDQGDGLYGGGGNDVIHGGAGDDRLVGGAGADVLLGGTGFDTYIAEGNDRIIDQDGRGILLDRDGRPVAGAWAKGTDGQYHWLNDPNQVATMNSPLTLHLEDGSTVVIENFTDGNLGINLIDSSAAIVPTLTLTGDKKPIDHDITTPEEDIEHDSLGNVVVGAIAAPGREDILYGSAGNDRIDGLLGDDDLHAKAGDDRIDGGDGRDLVNAGSGNDLVLGGSGGDLLGGGGGNDRLFAETEIDLTAIETQSGTGGGTTRELLAGGEGDDIVAGAGTADALFGGGGSDRIVDAEEASGVRYFKSRRWRDGGLRAWTGRTTKVGAGGTAWNRQWRIAA